METLKDIWASIVDYSKERGSNPLTAAFVLGWCFWNYKFFVLLFSALSPSKTFAAIDELYSVGYTRWLSGFLYPLLTAIFYVFAYPYVTERFLKFYRRRQVAISNELKKIEVERIRSPEEVARIVRQYERKIEGLNKEVSAQRIETDGLRLALQQLEASAAENVAAKNVEDVENTRTREKVEDQEEEEVEDKNETEDGRKIETAIDSSMKLIHDKVIVEAGPAVTPAAVGTYSRLDLIILSTLIENPGLNAAQLSARLKVARFWVEESLSGLIKRELLNSSGGSVYVRESGRAALRFLVAQGKIEIKMALE